MLGNWIRTTTTTTGAGNLTLAGVSGFPTFNDRFGTTQYFHYNILDDATGQPMESGIGHMSSSTVMVRDKISVTYVAGVLSNVAPTAAMLLTGTKRVICSTEEGAMAASMPGVAKSISGVAGYQVSAHLGNADAQSYTMVANRLFLTPYLHNSHSNIDGIGIRVVTGVASAELRFGIYGSDYTGLPTNLLWESTVGIAAATSSTEIVQSVTGMRLPPGWYWTGIISGHAPTVSGVAGGSTGILETPLGRATVDTRYRNLGSYIGTLTYASTLPLMTNPPTPLTVLGAASSMPIPFLRIAR